MHEDAELPGADGKGVEVELPDGGIGPEEVVAAKGASSDHQGVAGDYEPGLGVVPQNIVRRFRMASCCRKARFSRASSRCGPRLDRAVAKRAYSHGSMGVG